MITSKSCLTYAAIVATISLAYHNIFANDFVGDDPSFILYWQSIQSWLHLPELLHGALAEGHEGVYRPLRSLLYVFVYQLSGESPLGYHVFSLIVHTAATVLVLKITTRLTNHPWLPGITALLFAAHPIHTEAITFITSSFDIAGIIFMLGAFYLYLFMNPPCNGLNSDKDFRLYSQRKAGFEQSHQDIGTRSAYFLSLLLACLAFFTNEMTLVLPILLSWYEVTLGTLKGTSIYQIKRWKQVGTRLLPFGSLLAFYLWTRMGLLGIFGRGIYQADSFYLTSLITLKVWLKYLELLIWPVHLSLNHILPPGIHTYSVDDINLPAVLAQRWSDSSVLIPLILLISLCLMTLYARSRLPLISFWLGWIAISLLPVSNLVPNTCLLCERYTYLASVGFVGILGWGMITVVNRLTANFSQHKYLWLGALTLSITIGYSWLTWNRNRAWRSEVTLWETTVRQNPNATVYYKLGSAYQTQTKFPAAIHAYQQAIAITPQFSQVYHNLAVIAYDQQDLEQAKQHHLYALTLKPDLWESQAKLAKIYYEEEDYAAALTYYQLAYDQHPSREILQDLVACMNGYAQSQGDKNLQQTETILLQALSYDPQSVITLNNLGTVSALRKDYHTAKQYYQQALKLEPDFWQAKENIDRIKP